MYVSTEYHILRYLSIIVAVKRNRVQTKDKEPKLESGSGKEEEVENPFSAGLGVASC
jgi:hypothetical protein